MKSKETRQISLQTLKVLMFNATFNSISVVSRGTQFIGGGSRNTQRKNHRPADKLYHIYRVFLILFLTFGGLLLLLYSHFMKRPRNTRIWLEITMGFECVHSGCYELAVMSFIF